jgi:hypothetical protein
MEILSTEQARRFNTTSVVQMIDGRTELMEPEEWDYEPEVDDVLDPDAVARKDAELVRVSPSDFVEFSIKVPDKKAQKHIPFSFAQRRYLRQPYDTASKRTLYKCGRQVEKSTLLGNKSLAYAAINNAFNILYVSPTNQQTKVFSQDRLREPIETSDVLRAWTTTKLSDNVFLKKFINRSQITLRYAFHNADRVRGIPADMILLDEIQDIITENIPVIEQCYSHSPFKISIYSGTPKSTDNTIEKYWNEFSTQNEWVVPCERHGVPGDSSTWHWNVLSEPNIGKLGLICDKCGNLINPMHPNAQWASLNPSVRQTMKDPYEGFRIPQLMVPWIDWGELLDNYHIYPRAKFWNEVLGLSYDSGTKPLTRQDIIDNCDPGFFMTEAELSKIKYALGGGQPIWAGIDWGSDTNASYTVISLGAYINNKFTIFYIHRFVGKSIEPAVQMQEIIELLDAWRVKSVGVDYGGGLDKNNTLARRYGANRIHKYQYSTPSVKIRYDEGMARFMVHRTEVMTDLFDAIKRRNVFRFPDFQQFEKPYGEDMLNIFSEYSETQRMTMYSKTPGKTDDSFHSILYCFLASMIDHPRPDILKPKSKTSGAHED